MPSEIVTVALVSGAATALIGPLTNLLLGDRLARRKDRAQHEAAVDQAAIADGAKIRGELWERIKTLEEQLDRLRAEPRLDPEVLAGYERLDAMRRQRIEELEALIDETEDTARRLQHQLDETTSRIAAPRLLPPGE